MKGIQIFFKILWILSMFKTTSPGSFTNLLELNLKDSTIHYVNNTVPNMFTLNIPWCCCENDIEGKQRTCWVNYRSKLAKDIHAS